MAITGGIMAHHNLLVPWQVGGAAISGAFLSNISLFLLGRRYKGHARVQSIMKNKRLSGLLKKLDKNPARYASVFQFIPGMRIVGPIALAQSKIKMSEFAMRAGFSAVVWGLVYTVVGHAVGRFLDLIFGRMLHIENILIVAGLVLLFLFARAVWRLFRGKLYV